MLCVVVLIILRTAFRRFKKRSALADDLRKLHVFTNGYRLMKVFVILAAVLAVLQINGINISLFVYAVGALAVVAALAVKDSLQDVFASITIMLDSFFKVGDAVEYEGRDGIVVGFTMRSTKIECIDDRSVLVVANRNISRIRRLTHLVDIDLPLPYEEPRERVFAVLTDIARQIAALDGVESCELKGTQDFGASAILYKLRFFCEPADRPDIRRAALRTVQDGLAAAGIVIPYTQVDIHTK